MKKLIYIPLVFYLCFLFSVIAYATEEIKEDISERIFSANEEITDTLEDFGITSLDYESLCNISLKSILSYCKRGVTDYFTGCLSLFSKIFCLILIGGTVSVIIDANKYKSLIQYLVVPTVILILTEEIALCLSSALSLMRLNSNFMLSFVPVYAVTVALSGSPTVAITYNSLVIGMCEFISAIINYGFVDIMGCYFCLCIGFSVNTSINFSRFISSVNRFVTFSLGFISSVFTAFLSVKGIFSSTADSVVSKGIKFAVASLIPVIGSSISDAYSTLLGSISIIKSSVAIIGILAVTLINIPVIAEMVMFNISLNTLSFVSEIFDCFLLTDILKAFACGIKIICLLVIFEAFVLVISTAVMLSLKGG